MASIQARANASGDVTWRVQFRIDGRMHGKTFVHQDGAVSFGRLVDTVGGDAALKVLEARQSKNADMPTLREFTARYLDVDSGMLTGIEPGTRKGYERAAHASFLQILGEYPVDVIGKTEVGKWLAWQEQQPSHRTPGQKIAAKTIRNYHSILSAVMGAAVGQKLRDDNPAYRTRLSRGVKREAVFLTPDEFATVLYFIPDRYQGLVLFLAGTGCRWGEATAITWGNVTVRKQGAATVRIEKAWKKGETGAPVLKHPKSERGRRTISLTPDVVVAMGDPGAASELVFRGVFSGGHIWHHRFMESNWNPAVDKAMDKRLCKEAGLTVLTRRPTIHDLRHSHASWLIAGGAPLPYVQARLGHESINTTVGVYGHLVPDAHEQMAALIEKTLAGVRPLKLISA